MPLIEDTVKRVCCATFAPGSAGAGSAFHGALGSVPRSASAPVSASRSPPAAAHT